MRQKKHVNKEERLLICSRFGYTAEQAMLFHYKWLNHCKGAQKRGIKGLNFEHYMQLAAEAKITPKQIDHRKGFYMLCRYTDVGDYTLASCRFAVQYINFQDRDKNGGTARMAEKMTGRTKENHKGVASAAMKHAKEYVIISPTGKIYSGSNVFDFCKEHNLDSGGMSRMLRGLLNHYKGWTGFYSD